MRLPLFSTWSSRPLLSNLHLPSLPPAACPLADSLLGGEPGNHSAASRCHGREIAGRLWPHLPRHTAQPKPIWPSSFSQGHNPRSSPVPNFPPVLLLCRGSDSEARPGAPVPGIHLSPFSSLSLWSRETFLFLRVLV